jgi:hypothetical protein
MNASSSLEGFLIPLAAPIITNSYDHHIAAQRIQWIWANGSYQLLASDQAVRPDRAADRRRFADSTLRRGRWAPKADRTSLQSAGCS